MGSIWTKIHLKHYLEIDSNVEVDRYHRVGPRNLKSGQNQNHPQ